jgi:hypothetical protein
MSPVAVLLQMAVVLAAVLTVSLASASGAQSAVTVGPALQARASPSAPHLLH